jgi:hypothetical protein
LSFHAKEEIENHSLGKRNGFERMIAPHTLGFAEATNRQTRRFKAVEFCAAARTGANLLADRGAAPAVGVGSALSEKIGPGSVPMLNFWHVEAFR